MDDKQGIKGDILAIDDLPMNLDLLSRILTKAGYNVRTTTSGTFALQAARSAPPDLILLDIKMPEMDGFEVCRLLKQDQQLKGIPVIFISALSEIQDKLKAFEMGGVDYLTKPFQTAEVLARVRTHLNLYHMQTRLEDLVAERSADLLTKTLELQDEIEERKKTEQALRDAEFRYRTVADFTYAWEYWEGPDGLLRYVSPSCARITGYSADDFINNPDLLHRIIADQDRPIWKAHRHEAQTEYRPRETQFRILDAKGKVRWIEHACQHVIDSDGTFLGFRVSNRDISRAKELEKELRQAQKMEAIGTLAGGIAHDFNNILSCIFGYCELALLEKEITPTLREYLSSVIDTAHRAKDLVTQILTFSRKSEQELTPLQIALIIKEALKLLRASLPSSIAIEQTINAYDLVLADPTQIHQIVMNLCTNAYHAMRDTGGTLSVSLERKDFRKDDIFLDRDILPGSYLQLSINDTGCGMNEATREKIFEPYFTTKSPGEGTGLGLAVVDGIVRNHKGYISVYSEPGIGSTFHVYLPIHNQPGTSPALFAVVEESPLPSGSERILVVDDESNMVMIYQDLLGKYGYKVSAFASSQEALDAFHRHPEKFDLVVTDLTMPILDGIELAKHLLEIRSDLPVILCSGYSTRLSRERATLVGITGFLQKPFGKADLLLAIRKGLDGVPGKSEPTPPV